MLSKFKDPAFALSLLATVLGLLLSFHLVGPSTSLYRAIGLVLVVLSDLGVQALRPAPVVTDPTPPAGN